MKTNKMTGLFFYIIVFALGAFVAYSPNFGVIDDHTLTESLLVGNPIGISTAYMPDIGRFFPLNGQELNVLSFLFSPKPFVFYSFNALLLLIVAYCLSSAFYLLLKEKFERARLISYCLVILIFLTPAFVTSWLRLFVPERMGFVFLSLFFYTYVLLYLDITKKKIFVSIICILSSLISLFYKETMFILVGVFSFLHLLFAFKMQKKIFKVDLWIICNSVAWIVCYVYFVILSRNGSGSYANSPYNRIFILLKDFMNFLCNDPILIIGLSLILCLRIYDVVCKKQKIFPLFDAMIIASFLFVSAYIYLGISNLHYLLPAYLFAIPSCFYYANMYIKNILVKISIAFIVLIMLMNCVPLTLYYAMFYKFVPQNFQSTLVFLRQFSQENPNKVLNIYLEGVNRASGIEAYVSFQQWMRFYKIQRFDFFSDLAIDHEFLGKSDPNSPYTVFRSNDIVEKELGDIVILMPYSGSLITYAKIEHFKKRYKLLYVANNGLNIPFLGLKALFKWINIQVRGNKDDFLLNHNVFGLPIYFYVFEVQ